jgi:hypothetical protein
MADQARPENDSPAGPDPEFTLTDDEGSVHATFTLARDGTVTSTSARVADMVRSMIESRGWTWEDAADAFTAGWSNGYLRIQSSTQADAGEAHSPAPESFDR